MTRSQSSTNLPGELILRVGAQNELVEAINDLLSQTTELGVDATLSEVDSMLQQVDEMHQAFRAEHTWLVTNWPPAHLDHYYFTRRVGVVESKTVVKVKRTLSRLRDQLTQTTQSAQPAEAPASEARSRSRLPELNVPTFSGDSLAWPDYKAMFISVIGSRTELDDLEKFQYLRSALIGEAAELIRYLTPHPSSYEAAWKLLNARYENKRLILTAHLDRLLTLKPMPSRKSSRLNKMVTILNETTQAIHTLTTVGNVSHNIERVSNHDSTHRLPALSCSHTRSHRKHRCGSARQYEQG